MSTLLILILTLIALIQPIKANDSTAFSGIAKDYVISKIKEDNKTYKNLQVKAYYKLSKTNSIIGIRTFLIQEGEYYNFIVNVNHENPKKPYGQTFFSVSDKQREEMFKNIQPHSGK